VVRASNRGVVFHLLLTVLFSGVLCRQTAWPDTVDVSNPRGYNAPDLSNLVQEVTVGQSHIRVYGSKSSESLWMSERDPVVYTSGTTDSPYFYPQLPEPDSVIFRAETSYFNLDSSKALMVTVSGLAPDTAYYYQVGDSVELVRFRTKPKPGSFSPFTFSVVSDSQGPYDAEGDEKLNKDRHKQGPFAQVNVAADFPFNVTVDSMRQAIVPDFSVHCGDIIEDARYTVQWEKELFGELKYYLTQAPVFFVMGNHEQHDARVWRYFDLPLGPEERLPHRAFYSFDWGQAHFIVLDFNGGWYEILDIDEVPSFHTYQVTPKVLSQLQVFLTEEMAESLQSLAGAELRQTAFREALASAGIRGPESRLVRTAALVDIGFNKPYSVSCRNIELGRLSFSRRVDPEFQKYQVEWLKRDLERNEDKRYIFAFSHHPICYGGPVRAPYGTLFEQHGVTATFSGHQHVYAHNRRNGVHYFQAAGLSNTVFSALQDCPSETFVFHRWGPHYVVVNVEEDRAVVIGLSRENEAFEKTVLKPRF